MGSVTRSVLACFNSKHLLVDESFRHGSIAFSFSHAITRRRHINLPKNRSIRLRFLPARVSD